MYRRQGQISWQEGLQAGWTSTDCMPHATGTQKDQFEQAGSERRRNKQLPVCRSTKAGKQGAQGPTSFRFSSFVFTFWKGSAQQIRSTQAVAPSAATPPEQRQTKFAQKAAGRGCRPSDPHSLSISLLVASLTS